MLSFDSWWLGGSILEVSKLDDSIINNSYLLDCSASSENVFLDLPNNLNLNILSSVYVQFL